MHARLRAYARDTIAFARSPPPPPPPPQNTIASLKKEIEKAWKMVSALS
jgi:hypothetical protein